MTTAELRAAVVAALGVIPEVAAGDWTVLESPYDAVAPPVFVVAWGPDQWRTVATTCTDDAQLQVMAVSARLTPEATYPILEGMVEQANGVLTTARLRPYMTGAPGPLELGQITYLAARMLLRRPVDTGGNP